MDVHSIRYEKDVNVAIGNVDSHPSCQALCTRATELLLTTYVLGMRPKLRSHETRSYRVINDALVRIYRFAFHLHFIYTF